MSWSECLRPSVLVPVYLSECLDPSVLVQISWSKCFDPSALVRMSWSVWKGDDWKLSRGSVSLPLVNGAAMGGESGCFTWTDCQMVADNKQQVLNFTIWDIFTIWEKYILQFETNTFCNLREIHFSIWDKYILQFRTNTFCNLCRIVKWSAASAPTSCQIRPQLQSRPTTVLQIRNIQITTLSIFKFSRVLPN